ncbi:hypothetical protein [Aquipuribacter sp. MA13-6]|uniref:hypothetical protein n=1 Tax=unclassified Aquipuribacter TaxID=2635084 RepID=UPI003EEC5A31
MPDPALPHPVRPHHPTRDDRSTRSHRAGGPRGRGLPLLLPLLAYGLGSVDWQQVLRRTGMPFRSPADDPARAALAVGGSVAGGLLATATAGTVMAAVTRLPAARAASALAPAAAAAVVPLPLVGIGAGAYVEAATAWRSARAGTADPAQAALRAGVGVVAFGLVHGLISSGVERLLDATVPAPPRPPAAPPASRLNLVGPDVGDTEDGPDGFVVYLDGVGRCERRTTPVGRRFAAAVAERLPRWTVVLSLMPNDVTQEPAWLRPVTGRLWRSLHRASPGWTVARGVWEAVVALDPRYRDRLAQEHTRQVAAHLLAAGYRSGSGTPVVLVGLSGGAQTGLRVASEVARSLGGAPVDVVTFGSFADGSADLSGVRRVHAVVSWADPAELLPVLLFPSRWTALGVGAWQRARREGTVVVRRHDWATHVGEHGYLSPSAHAPDGRTRLAQAADVVAAAAWQLLGGRSRVESS